MRRRSVLPIVLGLLAVSLLSAVLTLSAPATYTAWTTRVVTYTTATQTSSVYVAELTYVVLALDTIYITLGRDEGVVVTTLFVTVPVISGDPLTKYISVHGYRTSEVTRTAVVWAYRTMERTETLSALVSYTTVGTARTSFDPTAALGFIVIALLIVASLLSVRKKKA